MKRFAFELKQNVLKALRLFFSFAGGGKKCIVCGSNTLLLPVCALCDRKYFSVPSRADFAKRCSVCGKILLSTQGKCMKCRKEAVLTHTDGVFPLYSYRLWNKTLLFEWKIKGERCLSEFFAHKISLLLEELLKDLCFKVIVPVPPRKGKIHAKGWDQVDEVSGFLELRYGFRVLKVLRRVSVQEQKKLTREQRLGYIGTAYAMRSGKELKRSLKKIGGKLPEEVCLLDDVSTTGSTLESCAEALKAAGVKKVFAVTLFTVD